MWWGELSSVTRDSLKFNTDTDSGVLRLDNCQDVHDIIFARREVS